MANMTPIRPLDRPLRRLELRDMREAAGLTQAQLAERLGTTLYSVSRWELGDRKISLPMSRLIRRIFREIKRR